MSERLNQKQKELVRLLQDLWAKREKQFAQGLQQYQEEVQARDKRISDLLNSMSWRITSPMRALHQMVSAPSEQIAHSQSQSPDPLPSVEEVATSLLKIHARETLNDSSLASLEIFLKSAGRLVVPSSDSPEVSIILVLYNRADLTHLCLRSLACDRLESAEVIVVDNASSDATEALLKRVDGVRIIRNNENRHFLLAANQAARQAKGEYLLFLNNDTEVMPGSISAALNTHKGSVDIGAVGGKLIFPQGSLQEAGSIIWNDGSCVAYGRGDDPFLPTYMFRRDVDYCSAAFLLTKRQLFLEMGGFDESYQPAYYEDSDYCARLWQRGRRVVYEPEAIVIHHEFGSSASQQQGLELQSRNRSIFSQKHAEWLGKQRKPAQENILVARQRGKAVRRVLLIDDCVPHPRLGAGYPRANTLVRGLIQCGCFVTHYPLIVHTEPWEGVYTDFPREVEVMMSWSESNLERFLTERRGYYDTMLISRPLNMEVMDPLMEKRPELFEGIDILYDAEAIFAFRELRKRRVLGATQSPDQEKELLDREIKLARFAKTVICVSEEECSHFKKAGIPNVALLAHSVPVQPTPNLFEQRAGFLFVGFVYDEVSPNGDSLLWFLDEIYPKLQGRLGSQAAFTFAGLNNAKKLAAIKQAGVTLAGVVPDLTPFYNQARVFVAPTRYSAGLPMKVHEAASRGLPVVGTSLLAGQLGWKDGQDMLVADNAQGFADVCIQLYTDPALWSRIRENALERVRKECSPEAFLAKLKAILDAL